MSIQIVPITSRYDDEIKNIIETVGKEFGAVGEGFGPSDPEVQAMSQHYGPEFSSLYLVALDEDGEVLGGCGVAPFNESTLTCELKKLFLSPKSRGKGAGKALSLACLEFAKEQGFTHCYLDTLKTMTAAIKLYESMGFEHLDQPLETEHTGCDVWMMKAL